MTSLTKRIVVLLILSSFLVSCASSLYTLDTNLRRRRADLEEKTVKIKSYVISYLEGGSGETGETVVLLHGFGADKDNWVRFARYLKEKYHVVVPDLPGFGESTRIMSDNYDIDSQVRRIHDFVTKIGLRKFHIAGNSMGGLISAIYAAEYPEKILSLGLLNPGGVAERNPSRLSIELKNGNNPLIVKKEDDFETLINFVFVEPPFIPSHVKTYLGKLAVANKDFYEKVFVEAAPGGLLEEKMEAIRARTLIIWGDQDRVFPVSSGSVLDNGIRDSKLVVLKQCGHLPMMERPEETAQYYLDYIASTHK